MNACGFHGGLRCGRSLLAALLLLLAAGSGRGLSAQSAFGTVAMGASTTQAFTVTITSAGKTNSAPTTAVQALTLGATGLDFRLTPGGTCGPSLTVTAGQTCTVNVTFAPIAPGLRMGAVVLLDGSSTPAPLATTYIQGTGSSPLATLTPGMITTVAGNGTGTVTTSADGGPATATGILQPGGLAFDGNGNLYVADSGTSLVRKVSPGGIISTVAGTTSASSGTIGDGGPATNAQLSSPVGLAVDGAGNLYIGDSNNCRVRMVSAATGIINTVAGSASCFGFLGDGGPATSATLYTPTNITLDGAGNLYIVDIGDYAIRKVTAATGMITTIAGTGSRSSLSCPMKTDAVGDGCPATSISLVAGQIVADPAGNLLLIDTTRLRVRRIDAVTGIITTVAGTGQLNSSGASVYSGDGGPAISAGLAGPQGISIDAAGDLYISDDGAFNRIRKVTAATGIINSIAGIGARLPWLPTYSGDGGAATSAALQGPADLALDAAGNLYIADVSNQRFRKISATGAPFVFDTANAGSTSVDSPQTSTLNNIGNAGLAFTVPSSATNPVVPNGFSVGGASTCPLLQTGSGPSTLAAGASCTDLISFSPFQAVPYSGSLVTSDNSLNVNTVTALAVSGNGNPSNAPVVSSISPLAGPTTGGTTVTITGSGFTGATSVAFGSVAAASFMVNSSTQITAVSPAGSLGAAVDITVTTSNGTSGANAGDVFTFIEAIAVTPVPSPAVTGTTVQLQATASLGSTVFFSIAVTSDNPTLGTTCSGLQCTANAYLFSCGTNLDCVTFTHSGSVIINAFPYNGVSQPLQTVSQTVLVQGQTLMVANPGYQGVTAEYPIGNSERITSTHGSIGIAVDASGNAWSINQGGNYVSVFNNYGVYQYAYSGLAGATALAMDGASSIWIANNNGTLSVMNSAGSITSTVADSTLANATGIAVDISGNVWIANSSNNSVDEVLGGAAPVAPLTNGVTTNTLGVKP